ncbi:hypothetical protein PENSOL_c164G03158 [Penicillium solitum]|uniref:Uncharacterized protein n=1 Tax=Penicillium solitum TaxID=60172 RepID=A0A1V6Q2A1_9EURO|nr:uncharacterized protein PENSOL_c164G03158 [Penicillium solitum]OQD82992.1 hypothetical protein PENSOL_c164G03158 [Penicillium solitum]
MDVFREFSLNPVFKVVLYGERAGALVFADLLVVLEALQRRFYEFSAGMDDARGSRRIVPGDIHQFDEVTVAIDHLFTGRVALDSSVIVVDLLDIVNDRSSDVSIYIA